MSQHVHTIITSIQKNVDRERWSAEEYTRRCGRKMDMADLKVHFHARLYIQVFYAMVGELVCRKKACQHGFHYIKISNRE